MAKGDYYFPLFYKRLLTSTIGWTDDEFGCYLRLLIYQFDNGAIPSDLEQLKRISPSVKKHWKLISGKFKDNGSGGLVNEVMDEVYHKVQKKKLSSAKNGTLGGRPKTKHEEKPTGLGLGSENETQLKAIPIINKPIIKEREETPTLFTIEHCSVCALNDTRWTKANHTNEKELQEFNRLLESRGVYEKNILDYKHHFANWKRTGKKEIKIEEAKTFFNPALKNKIG